MEIKATNLGSPSKSGPSLQTCFNIHYTPENRNTFNAFSGRSTIPNRKISKRRHEDTNCLDLEIPNVGSQAGWPCRDAPADELGDSILLMICCDSDSNPDHDFGKFGNSHITRVLWSFNHTRGQPFPLRVQQIDLKIIENQNKKSRKAEPEIWTPNFEF